ncbi:Ead/Ea22-like protein [Enterobacter hormaechei subsp. xiangfangensis]|nr:ead/Ea22-like family protein [Enterobacter hormaechei]KHG56188.1 Ead/Ea22-like protein [Enterobacter hormaechei subsp. xiangfangensis]
MSNIDKQTLRDIATAAVSTPLWHAVGVFGEVVDPANPEWKPVHDFCKTFTAERVLALLDELEAKEKRIAELEAREVVLPSTQDVHPLGPQSAKIFCEFHRSIVNRCADEIRKVGVKVSIKGN